MGKPAPTFPDEVPAGVSLTEVLAQMFLPPEKAPAP